MSLIKSLVQCLSRYVGLKVDTIIWLENIVNKINVKHGVNRNEVIEVLENKPYFLFVEKGFRKGENVYAALGRTFTGRYLAIFFVYKANKSALIISARSMTIK